MIGVARPQRRNFDSSALFVVCWSIYWGWPVVAALVSAWVLTAFAFVTFPGLGLIWFAVILAGLIYLVHLRGRVPSFRLDRKSLSALDADFATSILNRERLSQVWHAAQVTAPAGVDKQGRALPDHMPLVSGAWSVPTGLVVQAQIVPGAQTVGLFEQRAESLASAFRVDAVEVKRGCCSTEVELLLVRRDGLNGIRDVRLDDPTDPSAPWSRQ